MHTMAELKLTGNCLRGSRPLLSFDPTFSEKPQYQLLKELFTQIFGVPKHHPKSQPFFDHVYTFTVLDNRIWFRNFQILSEDGALAEIGPRFVLNPVSVIKRFLLERFVSYCVSGENFFWEFWWRSIVGKSTLSKSSEIQADAKIEEQK